MSSITAILVSYNSAGVIAGALRALLQEPLIAEIIVVDNASKDNTAAMIAHEFPSVTLVSNVRNEGFGRANNSALEQVKTSYALLVNPDAVLENGALSALLMAAKQYPDAAILAPQLVDEAGHLTINYKEHVFNREKNRKQLNAASEDRAVEYLSGAVMLWNMAHMKKVGFFDPHIFLFYEDDDICMRSNAAGFCNMLVVGARAMHLQGASSGTPNPASEYFKQKHMVRSRIYLERKYHGQASAKELALRLRLEYIAKAAAYALTFNKQKFARYRGRVAGTLG